MFCSFCCILQVNLSRFDLHEGHLFVEDTSGECGMLFRARAYPKFDNDTFPVNLGFCQEGSDVEFDQHSMDLRNFLWFQGNLAVLDLSEGSPLQDLLLQADNETRLLRTTFEEDWGTAVATINYFEQLEGLPKEEKIFVC
ncbi:unnamed protein product [Ostreobium quekettii]|uniref:Uncharacterized protein n=1 Tax=Ostreobium quekettii TaxID=121088 RepID=A0A8S1JGF3_9CHLO|nr:unnamed protein product [Ostreobium quekettii]|eukprot:evm.model.scf_2795.2 EVM.evm.TU.scf_2795.2   scf_2795:5919-8101(-)